MLGFSLLVLARLLVPMHVQPTSAWYAFELRRRHLIELPPKVQLAPVCLFPGTRARHLLLFNDYEVHSPFFVGRRLEVVVMAKRPREAPHFRVVDCYTDTFDWNPTSGLGFANAVYSHRTIVRATRERHLRTRIRSGQRFFDVDARFSTRARQLTRAFAVDANRQCGFGAHDDLYAMSFNDTEILAPVAPLLETRVATNLWTPHRGSFVTAFAHLHPMHFCVDVPDVV